MSEIVSPYLSEHESPNKSDGGKPGYNPPPEERKIIKLVDSILTRAKKYRKRYDVRWIDFYKMFRGKQWKETRPSYRHSEVLNLIFQTIESMIPVLTDSHPKLEFLPTVPSQFELADILTKVADNDWQHNNWLMTLTEIIYDAHFYGTGFAYCGYDPKANMGLGNICFESADPFYTFPDPQARDINEKRTRHFIYSEPTDLSELKKEYPEKAEYITSDVIDFAQGDKADIYQVMFKSPTDSRLMVEGNSAYDSIAKNQALKTTLYLKDEELEELEDKQFNDDGTPKLDDSGAQATETIQKLKYPNGRKIVVAGGVLLEDGPNTFDHGLFPYSKLVNYILPREFWGMGEVEQLEGPQKTINKLISFTLDVMTLMGNPIWVVGSDAGIDTDNLFNKPGLIVETDNPASVRREPGIEIPGGVLQLLDRFKGYFDGISGETDLSRGAEPSDVTAASAISTLQEAQQTRLRLKSRNIDAFLTDFGKQYLSNVFQFYSVPRIVRVSGDDNADQFFYFHVEKLDADPETQAPYIDQDGNPAPKRFAHITQTDSSGVAQSKIIEIQGDFDVRVSTGSTLPFAKEQKTQLAMNLFKLQVIDDEELLKTCDWPDYQQVLMRVQQKKDQSQQQQMAMQQQQMQAQVQAKQAMQGGQPPASAQAS